MSYNAGDPDASIIDETKIKATLGSERRYQAFLRHSSDALWRIELELPLRAGRGSEEEQIEHLYQHGFLAEYNDAFARIHGYDATNLLTGKRYGDIHSRDDASHLAFLRTFIRGGYQISDVETVSVDLLGQPHYYSLSMQGLIENDSLLHIWGSQRDISYQRQLESELREREERLLGLFHQAAAPMAFYGLDGKHLYTNHAMQNMLGYTEEEFAGISLIKLGRPADNEILADSLPRLVRGDLKIIDIESAFIRKDRSLTWVHAIVSLVKDDSGNPIYLMGTIHDITEHRQAEIILSERSNELNRERQWLEKVIDLMPTPVIIVEQDPAYVRFANRAAHAMVGGQHPTNISVDEMATMFRVTYPGGTPISPDQMPIVRAARGEQISDIEVVFNLETGPRSFLVSADHLAEMYGHPATILVTYQDITTLKLAERENIELLRQAQRGALLQRKFLRDVLASVTEGKLRLCDTRRQLPKRLKQIGPKVELRETMHLKDLRDHVREVCQNLGFSEIGWQHIVTSASECAMNAIVHGGGGVASVHSDGISNVQVWVSDKGGGIEMEHIPQATLLRGYSSAGSFGHGFWLMLQTTDRVHLLTGRRGTTVALEKAKEEPLSNLVLNTKKIKEAASRHIPSRLG